MGTVVVPPTELIRSIRVQSQSKIAKHGSIDAETVRTVLRKVDNVSSRLRNNGFNENVFTLGVSNCILVTYIFAAYPQHFWLLYLLQSLYLIPAKVTNSIKAKPLNQVLYYLDFCWMMNFTGITVLFIQIANPSFMTRSVREELMLAVCGISFGPLVAATACLPFVSVSFHDINEMTGLFIHLLPPLMMHIIFWDYDTVSKAWPDYFLLDHPNNDINFFPTEGFRHLFAGGNVFGNALFVYLVWFLLYVFWMLALGGIDLPRAVRHKKGMDRLPVHAKYDTVFHNTMGGFPFMGKVILGLPLDRSNMKAKANDYEVKEFLVYMCAHLILVVGSLLTFGKLCVESKKGSIGVLIFLVFIAIYRGAKKYTYYATQMYGKQIIKEFKAELEQQAKLE